MGPQHKLLFQSPADVALKHLTRISQVWRFQRAQSELLIGSHQEAARRARAALEETRKVLETRNRDPPGPPLAFAAPSLDAFGEDLEALPGPGIHFLHGTTTLAFKFPQGVAVAVDSRATAGSYIASQSVQKILEVTGWVLGTMAGGAADCRFWQRLLARQSRVHHLRNKEPISVAAASKLLANMVYQYRGMGLSIGTMICGWDKRGPGLYYVDSEGTRIPGSAFAVGSGSPYAWGVLDRGLREEPPQEASAAAELARRAIYGASRRDAYSGGSVTVCIVGAHGWHRVWCDSVTRLQELYGGD